MTEIEVALASMTLDELREAGDYIDELAVQFRRTRQIHHGRVAATEGPSLALDGLKLAWLREVTVRYGAPEWFAGMPTDGHEARGLLDLLLERMTLNPDRRLRRSARDRAAGLDKRCASCHVRYPLTAEHFEQVGAGLFSAYCRGCEAGARARANPFPESADVAR